MSAAALDRRSFIAGGAGLLVSIALPAAGQSEGGDAAAGNGLPRDRLDSWLAIDPQGRVTASVGKIDAGLGIPTAFAQIVAEELDVAFAQVSVRMGDTATTVDQRGTGSSNGITDPTVLHPVQQAFIDEQAAQCGYCINGWIMTAVALLEAKPQASDTELREGLSGLKCRCGTQVSVLRAVKRAAQQMRDTKVPA